MAMSNFTVEETKTSSNVMAGHDVNDQPGDSGSGLSSFKGMSKQKFDEGEQRLDDPAVNSDAGSLEFESYFSMCHVENLQNTVAQTSAL